MSNGDWYCKNCGYVDGRNVTFSETCGTCRVPVVWHDANEKSALAEANETIAQLQARLHEVREIYTGSDGFIPATAPEAYCLRIMYQMYRAAVGPQEGE